MEIIAETPESKDVLLPISSEDVTAPQPPKPPTIKKKVQRKKSRIELFEEVDVSCINTIKTEFICLFNTFSSN